MGERLLFADNEHESGKLDDPKRVALTDPAVKLSNAVVFLDIDGVLADLRHRLPYKEKKEYDKFYGAAMAADVVGIDYTTIMPFLAGLDRVYDKVTFILLTGRPEESRALTTMWIRYSLPFFDDVDIEHTMLMRNDGDHRPSCIVKWEKIKMWLENTPQEVVNDTDIFMVDDDYHNIKYASDQTNHGGFEYEYIHCLTVGAQRLPEVDIKSSERNNTSSK